MLTDEIIEFCAASPKFQHHFHIPLQSGSNPILALMRRRYTTERFAARIAKVRECMPDAFIGIDVIVGFPGESDEHFNQTYNFLEQLSPSFLHIFPYSVRKGTPAADMAGKVTPSVSSERVERLEALNKLLHRSFCQKAIGTTESVLFESTIRGGMMFGFTPTYRRVRTPYEKSKINAICEVKIDAIDDSNDLIGQIIE